MRVRAGSGVVAAPVVLAAQEGGAGCGRGGGALRLGARMERGGAGPCLPGVPNTVHGAAAAGRGPEVKYRPGQECRADPRGRRPPLVPLPPLLVKKRRSRTSLELSGEWP